jgi:two-component system sensor histidine kinase BaeS
MVIVVLASAAATAALGVVLLQRADDAAARHSLAVLADVYQAEQNVGVTPGAGQSALGVANVRRALVSRNGKVAGDALARQAVTLAQAQQLLAGKVLSIRTEVAGVVVFVEARPTTDGGLILAVRQADTTRTFADSLPIWYLSIAGIALAAALIGLLIAWRVTRPMRRLAEGASALAQGHREPVAVEGPSEVRALAARINDLSSSLAHAEVRQREFLLSVSHDLRTPLATVMGYAESLAAGEVPASDVTSVGVVLHQESTRLAHMVSDLLDLARLDADELVMELRPADLASLIAEAFAAWHDRCATQSVTLRLTGERHPIQSNTDPQRLRQAIDGLLDNALRVTPSGGSIILDLSADATTARIEVRDTGPGLEDDDLAVAFDRGALHERYRGRRHVGTGLGLALVDRLVRRQGGSVTAGHAPEGGACFTISIPLLTVS